MVDEKEVLYERVIVVPLGKAWSRPRYKRSKASVTLLRKFVARHMRARIEDIWIDMDVNKVLWSRGARHPPRKIRIKAVKWGDQKVEVSLPED